MSSLVMYFYCISRLFRPRLTPDENSSSCHNKPSTISLIVLDLPKDVPVPVSNPNPSPSNAVKEVSNLSQVPVNSILWVSSEDVRQTLPNKEQSNDMKLPNKSPGSGDLDIWAFEGSESKDNTKTTYNVISKPFQRNAKGTVNDVCQSDRTPVPPHHQTNTSALKSSSGINHLDKRSNIVRTDVSLVMTGSGVDSSERYSSKLVTQDFSSMQRKRRRQLQSQAADSRDVINGDANNTMRSSFDEYKFFDDAQFNGDAIHTINRLVLVSDNQEQGCDEMVLSTSAIDDGIVSSDSSSSPVIKSNRHMSKYDQDLDRTEGTRDKNVLWSKNIHRQTSSVRSHGDVEPAKDALWPKLSDKTKLRQDKQVDSRTSHSVGSDTASCEMDSRIPPRAIPRPTARNEVHSTSTISDRSAVNRPLDLNDCLSSSERLWTDAPFSGASGSARHNQSVQPLSLFFHFP